jgi:hypothetical protein
VIRDEITDRYFREDEPYPPYVYVYPGYGRYHRHYWGYSYRPIRPYRFHRYTYDGSPDYTVDRGMGPRLQNFDGPVPLRYLRRR